MIQDDYLEYQSYPNVCYGKIYFWILETFKLVILRLSMAIQAIFESAWEIQGYYGPLYTDVESETEAARPSYLEYFIIFEPQAQDGAPQWCERGFINPINYI